jgi:outer membrane protein assembly factor BamB
MQIPKERRGVLPQVKAAEEFVSPEGRRGWRVEIPGSRPLATPAVGAGRVFLGGGFGSYEFYAFDAITGALDWAYQTSDDGPTAAVVSGEFVAFNTESCELEVLTVTGQPVWKAWLGDPLMSMPAVADGWVYQAFPDSRKDHRHYLGCFRLTDGHERWRTPITGDVITAPVVSGGCVYFANLDGRVSCVRCEDGSVAWSEPRGATSSPAVWEGECYFSRQEERTSAKATDEGMDKFEWIGSQPVEGGDEVREMKGTYAQADYLHFLKRQRRSPRYAASERHDAHVGFAHAKGSAKIDQARVNLGHGHVHSVWAYQGSKPFVRRGRLYAAQGDALSCVDPKGGEVIWKTKVGERPEGAELLDHPLTPPATLDGKLFLGSTEGKLHCVSAEDGSTLWTATLGDSVAFQPAVAGGRVYAATDHGALLCLETGDPADDGWLMWGADAAHNGRPA